MHKWHVLGKHLQAINWLKLSFFAFLTIWLGSHLQWKCLEAKIFMTSWAVELAYLKEIHWLDTKHTELNSIGILFEESLLHTLFFSSIALETLTVFRVRKEDFCKRYVQEVFVHRSYIWYCLWLFKHIFNCIIKRCWCLLLILPYCTRVNFERDWLTSIVCVSDKLRRFSRLASENCDW